MIADEQELKKGLQKWQKVLRLQDWDIKLQPVDQKWRKTGDVKVDRDDRKAVLMVNVFNPSSENLEEVIIHELLHIKLWDMDQMLEGLLHSVFGNEEQDPRFQFAQHQFMIMLEATVEDLTKSFLELGGNCTDLSFGRLQSSIEEELSSGEKE